MQTLTMTIRPRAAFGGPIRGDTLFGQICWAARHRFGDDRLQTLLQGYTEGAPFLVVSDAFPAGYLPRPALPLYRFREAPDADRKQVKKRQWLPVAQFEKPLADWLNHAVAERETVECTEQAKRESVSETIAQPHNTINRMTGTTGTGEFAPYAMEQTWFAAGQRFDLYCTWDDRRLSEDELKKLLADVGVSGYGRDASIGLGKFEIVDADVGPWPAQQNANAWITLAPCAPQGLAWNTERSWHQPFTRFGRHGDLAVHSGRPFKTPLLLADTAALLTPQAWRDTTFIGQGLGGHGLLSKAIPETVHQGYAPVLPICLEESK